MTAAEIAALPGSWYASQPVPIRLLKALADASPGAKDDYCTVPRPLLAQAIPPSRSRLSPVEQAHVRHKNRLVREHR